MNAKPTPCNEAPATSRSGIALVVVLGLLSVLVVLGVTFAVNMRTERMATRSYLDNVRARHLMDAALSRVVTVDILDAMEGRAYPDRDTFLSDGGGDSVQLRTAVGRRYAPVPPGAADEERSFWIDMNDDEGNFVGQYAFLIHNASGLLDANVMGLYEENEDERGIGLDPREILVDEGLLTIPRADLDDAPFETIPELIAVAGWDTDAVPSRAFHVYSRFPAGRSYESGEGAQVAARAFGTAYIGGDPDEWDEAAISGAIVRRSGGQDLEALPGGAIQDFIDIMHDYASEGYQPRWLSEGQADGPGFKRVPMINEVVVTLSAEAGGEDFEADFATVNIEIVIETAYLFPEVSADAPSFSVDIGEPTVTVGGATVQVDFTAEDGTEVFVDPDDPYHVVRFTAESVSPDGMDVGEELSVEVEFNDPIDVRTGVGAVNRVLADWEEGAFQEDVVIGGEVEIIGWSTNDPRLNWDPSNETHWKKAESEDDITLGERNEWTVSAAHGEDDEYDFMYCAQRPFNSVAELSYLLYDAEKPWSTIRLLGPDPDDSARLLDRFTVIDPEAQEEYPGEKTGRGRVNINTRDDRCLASVFVGAPTGRYEETGATLDDQNTARWVARRLRTARSEPWWNMSGLTEIRGDDIARRYPPDTVDIGAKFRNESLFRNSWNLLGTRQNLFTVLLAVRTFPDGLDGPDPDLVMAEQRAVAVVWRDPYASGVGRPHEAFIRFFAWLMEDEL